MPGGSGDDGSTSGQDSGPRGSSPDFLRQTGTGLWNHLNSSTRAATSTMSTSRSSSRATTLTPGRLPKRSGGPRRFRRSAESPGRAGRRRSNSLPASGCCNWGIRRNGCWPTRFVRSSRRCRPRQTHGHTLPVASSFGYRLGCFLSSGTAVVNFLRSSSRTSQRGILDWTWTSTATLKGTPNKPLKLAARVD